MKKAKIHLHPITVHFSNGLIPVAVFFLMLFFIFDTKEFEITAFYTLAVGSLGSFVAIFTGLIDWKKNYRGAWVPIFKKKLTAGVLAALGGSAACIIRYLYPDILFTFTPLTFVYLGLALFALACVTGAGHWGGKLVFH